MLYTGDRVRLREFKAKYIVILLNMKKQLAEKYPDKKERVEFIVDRLATKLRNLRTFTLSDYIASLYDAVKEFPELQVLVPSEQEIAGLLAEGKH
jgi:uncharacterized hydantoinase/oxoprolinase family protein